jgi:phosphoenolpyruvate carboxykinase (GTP)
MGDYFGHWINIGAQMTKEQQPRFFHVNWFRKDGGKFLWPGFGENSRVLEWIFNRCDCPDDTGAVQTPVGKVPAEGALNLDGLDMDEDRLKKVMHVDYKQWLLEARAHTEFLEQFGDRLPAEMLVENKKLQDALADYAGED